MKIFVTGATGKVGSRLVPYLLEQGHSVRILVRDAERASALKEQGAEVVVGDLVDNENLTEAILGSDAVIHTAAQFRGGITEEVARAVNLDATVALAKAALEAGATRFVFTSTGNVYLGLSVDRPCREDDILVPPTEIYPKTKIAAEEALLELHREQGLDLRIMRLAFVYGSGDPHLKEILPYMAKRNPSKKMSMTHHVDVSKALLLAATTSGVDGHIYNVADDTFITVGELFKLQGEPEQVMPEEGWQPFNPWESTMDTEHIKKELYFTPKYPSVYAAQAAGAL
jgi:nucleoside-diphosphate-sugar epimerase